MVVISRLRSDFECSWFCCWFPDEEPNTCLKLALRLGIGGAAGVSGARAERTVSMLLFFLSFSVRLLPHCAVPSCSFPLTGKVALVFIFSALLKGRGTGTPMYRIDREHATRCITSRALSYPQCETMISNKRFGSGALGWVDHGEAESWRLMVAMATVSMVVSSLAMPSSVTVVVDWTVFSGNAEWRYVMRTWRYSVVVPPRPRWCSRSSIRSSELWRTWLRA